MKCLDQLNCLFLRSVGTFARALDCTSTVRQPSLHMSAAAASRDVTLVRFYSLLNLHWRDVSEEFSIDIALTDCSYVFKLLHVQPTGGCN